MKYNHMKAALTKSRSRGFGTIYAAIMLIVLFGFASFGVDYGFVQTAKTELQGAADAAARAAVAGISTGVSQAQTNGINIAGQNWVNGAALIITTSDIDFGTWNTGTRTFALLTGAAQANANSIRINAHLSVPLAFSRVIGLNSVTIHASSIAYISGSSYGIVGLTSMNNNTSGVWDSFNASAGAYSAGSAHSLATAAANSNITLNSSSVKGDAHPGVGKTCTGGTVTGSRAALSSTLSYASVSAGSAATTNNNNLLAGPDWSSPDFNHSGSTTITIPGGTYYVQDFKVSGNATVNMTGPVIMYIYGQVSISSSDINAYQGKPTNFKMYLLPTATLQLRFNTTIDADIYGPDTDMSFSGAATLCGRVIGQSLQQTGTGSIHQDESLGTAISLVK